MLEQKLNNILDSIEKYYYSDLDNHSKSLIISEKWSEYFKLSYQFKITIPRAYDLFLLGENNCFIVDANVKIFDICNQKVIDSVVILKSILERRKNGENVGISYDYVLVLLEWAISNTRKQIASLGVDLNNSSFNGFCDLAQISSLVPFENMGLVVTKNSIEDVFQSVNHHVFGTVTFPVFQNGKVENIMFLIDPTYRQFFTATRCNEGRYFVAIEDDNPIGPDPGYFMDNSLKINFSNELICNGFIVFNEENAKIYGDGFSYSNVSRNNISKMFPIINNTSGKEYIDKVKKHSTSYSLTINDLEEYAFCTNFPGMEDNISKNHY